MANDLMRNPLYWDAVEGHYPRKGFMTSVLFGGNQDTDTTILMYNAENLVRNPNFNEWADGTSAQPTGWLLEGASATVAREATTIHTQINNPSPTYSAAVTRAGTNLTFSQNVLKNFGPNDARSGIAYWKGRYIIGGMWLNCTTTAQAKVETYDGVTTTSSSDHGGSDAWTWLPTALVAVNASATELTIRAVLDTGNDVLYCSQALLFEARPLIKMKSTGNAQSISYPDPVEFDGMYLATLTGGTLQVSI